MRTLFKTNINWFVYLAMAFLIILIPNISILSYIALLISLHQFLLLFYSINYIIPIRYIFGFLMCLQFLIGPTLAYNGMDQYQYFLYKMQVPEQEYFSYAIPAVVCFIIGMHINCKNLEGEILDTKAIKSFIANRQKLPFMLIGVGFASSFLSQFVKSELGFIFYLLAGFKFLGVFMLILSDSKVKMWPMIGVYATIIASSLGEGMFHDLVTWGIFLGAIYAIYYKPSTVVKVFLILGFSITVTLIQVLKSDYRSALSSGEQAGIETFNKAYEEKQNEDQGIFSIKNLGSASVRINQGFIVSYIMKTIPAKMPFEDGEEMRKVFEAAILPRFLAPDKLRAGDKAIFTKYTGLQLKEGTSMGLSSLGDAYINFGTFGGSLFMFFLGLLYSFALKLFYKHSKSFPLLLLFTPLVFYYPIRPDCEFQTILGHFLKSIFLIYLVFQFWKKDFVADQLSIAV